MSLSQEYLHFLKMNGHDVGNQSLAIPNGALEVELTSFNTSGSVEDFVKCLNSYITYISFGNASQGSIIKISAMIDRDFNNTGADVAQYLNDYVKARYGYTIGPSLPPQEEVVPEENNAPTTTSVVLSQPIVGVLYTILESTLLANASDLDGDALSVVSGSLAAVGYTFTELSDSWTFTPLDTSPITINYQITDGTDTVAASATCTPAELSITPTISSFVVANDTIEQGATLTLNGQFSADGGYEFYEPGDTDPLGAYSTTLPPTSPSHFEVPRNHLNVTDSIKWSGHNTLQLISPVGPDSTYEGGFNPVMLPTPTDTLFMTYMLRLDPSMPDGTEDPSFAAQCKLARIGGGDGSNHSEGPQVGITMHTAEDSANIYGGAGAEFLLRAGTSRGDLPLYSKAKDGWVRVVIYHKLGTKNTADGSRLMRVIDSDGNQHYSARSWVSSPGTIYWNEPRVSDLPGDEIDGGWEVTDGCQTFNSEDNDLMSWFCSIFYGRKEHLQHWYVAGMTVNTTGESVWIGNAPTLEACTKQPVLVPHLSRTSSQITASIEMSDFDLEVDSLYAFVSNAGLVFSSGTLIHDNTLYQPPAPPATYYSATSASNAEYIDIPRWDSTDDRSCQIIVHGLVIPSTTTGLVYLCGGTDYKGVMIGYDPVLGKFRVGGESTKYITMSAPLAVDTKIDLTITRTATDCTIAVLGGDSKTLTDVNPPMDYISKLFYHRNHTSDAVSYDSIELIDPLVVDGTNNVHYKFASTDGGVTIVPVDSLGNGADGTSVGLAFTEIV